MTNQRLNFAAPGNVRAVGFPNSNRHAALRQRDVQFSYLSRQGAIERRTTTIPDNPLFRGAFNAFARGALVQTPQGPVAVEDLLPGMMVETIGGSPQRIGWTGSMASDAAGCTPSHDYLYRITEGSYGLGQGKPDLLLGPGARLMRPGQIGVETARLQSVKDLADGQQVVQVSPRTAVQLFHIALSSHRLIRVNDVTVESFHPGHAANMAVADDLFARYVSLFPHVRTLAEFGTVNYLR